MTREEALQLPIMKYTNKAGFRIDLSLAEINEVMGFGLDKDSDIIDRLLNYEVDGYGIFAIFRIGNITEVMADPKIKNPNSNIRTIFDDKLGRK